MTRPTARGPGYLRHLAQTWVKAAEPMIRLACLHRELRLSYPRWQIRDPSPIRTDPQASLLLRWEFLCQTVPGLRNWQTQVDSSLLLPLLRL